MEHNPQDASEGKAVVAVLAAVLERLVNSNAHIPSGENVTKFHALKAPAISIQQYLERIHKYASCSTECFILALIYIDRLIQRNNFILSELNVHRVCVTAILLAAKFFDDAYYNNAYYAKVGGVLVSEMNGLEVEFLFRINFSLHVTPDVFVKYQDELISHAIGAGLECPAEVSVPDAIQPVPVHIPIIPVPIVPVPIAAPAPVPVTTCNDMSGWDHQQSTQMHDEDSETHLHPPSIQIQQHQGSVPAPVSKSQEQLYTNAQDMQRHITPSPPHQHQRQNLQQNINQSMTIEEQDYDHDQYQKPTYHPTISPASSEPDEVHRNRNLFSHHSHSSPGINVHQSQIHRPRNNSYPVDPFPMNAYDYENHLPAHSRPSRSRHHSNYIPKKRARMHATVAATAAVAASATAAAAGEVLQVPVHVACNHFPPNMSPVNTPSHLINMTRGVYQQ